MHPRRQRGFRTPREPSHYKPNTQIAFHEHIKSRLHDLLTARGVVDDRRYFEDASSEKLISILDGIEAVMSQENGAATEQNASAQEGISAAAASSPQRCDAVTQTAPDDAGGRSHGRSGGTTRRFGEPHEEVDNTALWENERAAREEWYANYVGWIKYYEYVRYLESKRHHRSSEHAPGARGELQSLYEVSEPRQASVTSPRFDTTGSSLYTVR